MEQDQVFVPKTRSELGLPAFDPSKETLDGSSIKEEALKELWEAIGDAPLSAALGALSYLVRGDAYHMLMPHTHHINPTDRWLAYVPDHQRFWASALS